MYLSKIQVKERVLSTGTFGKVCDGRREDVTTLARIGAPTSAAHTPTCSLLLLRRRQEPSRRLSVGRQGLSVPPILSRGLERPGVKWVYLLLLLKVRVKTEGVSHSYSST